MKDYTTRRLAPPTSETFTALLSTIVVLRSERLQVLVIIATAMSALGPKALKEPGSQSGNQRVIKKCLTPPGHLTSILPLPQEEDGVFLLLLHPVVTFSGYRA